VPAFPSKNFSPQRHRYHRESEIVPTLDTGPDLKLCALCGEKFLLKSTVGRWPYAMQSKHLPNQMPERSITRLSCKPNPVRRLVHGILLVSRTLPVKELAHHGRHGLAKTSSGAYLPGKENNNGCA
jgi:hypothetical protein